MTKHVLIVDDSRVSRMMIRAYIQQREPSWSFAEPGTGDLAISMATTKTFDLVTMDVNMPGTSGMDAGELIKQHAPNTRVVMITANIQDAMRKRAMLANLEFMEKPVTEALIQRLLDTQPCGA